MTDGRRAAGTRPAAGARTAAGALRDAWHPGSMARVTANFRQYLMGWGEQETGEGDIDHFRSGLPQPQFNGVVRLRTLDAVGPAVATARQRLAGVPWWWWVGPDSPAGTTKALASHGAVELGGVPVMLRPLDRLAAAQEPADGLRITTVAGEDRLAELVRTYSTSMGVAPGLEADMVRIESLRRDNADIVRLAAVLHGQVVGTAVVILRQAVAGIFLVHVAESLRRRGIGAALTQAALREGRDRGMALAALAASPAGEPLYRRLGFSAVAEYRLFAFPVGDATV